MGLWCARGPGRRGGGPSRRRLPALHLRLDRGAQGLGHAAPRHHRACGLGPRLPAAGSRGRLREPRAVQLRHVALRPVLEPDRRRDARPRARRDPGARAAGGRAVEPGAGHDLVFGSGDSGPRGGRARARVARPVVAAGDRFRGRALPRTPPREAAPAPAVAALSLHLRLDRGERRRVPRVAARAPLRGVAADRPGLLALRVVRDRRGRRYGRRRRHGRASTARRRDRLRLPRTAGSRCCGVRVGRRRWRAVVPHRRPGHHPPRRRPALLGPDRQDGQGPRIPRRARRDRDQAAVPSCRRRGRRRAQGRPRRDSAGRAPGGTAHRRRRPQAYMVPERFVFHERLPRNLRGKVDYAALRAIDPDASR